MMGGSSTARELRHRAHSAAANVDGNEGTYNVVIEDDLARDEVGLS